MVNIISNNVKSEQSLIDKNSINQNTVDKNNQQHVDVKDFYAEGQQVKDTLTDKLTDIDLKGITGGVNPSNIKYQALVNDNNYVKNVNNANSLKQNIDFVQAANARAAQNDSSSSLHDFFNEVKNSIIIGKNDYLDVLKDIFSKYMNYVNALREALSSLTQYTKAGSKEGYIHVDFKAFRKAIEKVRNEYAKSGPDDDLLYLRVFCQHNSDGSFLRTIHGNEVHYGDSTEIDNALNAIEKLLKEIKGVLPSRSDQSKPPDSDTVFTATIDFSDLDKFLSELSAKGDDDILQTEFDLFKKSLDALEKRINTNLDEISKKYSAANTNFDNFVKVVSSTMNTLLEMAKGFLRY